MINISDHNLIMYITNSHLNIMSNIRLNIWLIQYYKYQWGTTWLSIVTEK
jgi:hypothetical protein